MIPDEHAQFLQSVLSIAYKVYHDPNDMIQSLLPVAPSLIEATRIEFVELTQNLQYRYSRCPLHYPAEWALEKGSTFFTYTLVRLLKPNTVLETGVANGQSSYFILNAMLKNQTGHLHSIDVSNNVGTLLEEPEKQRWTLHILQNIDLQGSFIRTVDGLPVIDLFIHDSDHRYPWQYFEYTSVLHKILPGGYIATDDVDDSTAFRDFCTEIIKEKPHLLLDNDRIFGIVSKK